MQYGPRYTRAISTTKKRRREIKRVGCYHKGMGLSHHLDDLPRHIASDLCYIAALASSQLVGSQPFTCDSALQAPNKSCGFHQGFGSRDEAPVHVNPEEIARLGWVFDVYQLCVYVILQRVMRYCTEPSDIYVRRHMLNMALQEIIIYHSSVQFNLPSLRLVCTPNPNLSATNHFRNRIPFTQWMRKRPPHSHPLTCL